MASSKSGRNNSLRSRGVVVGACKHCGEVGPEREQSIAFFLAQHAQSIAFTA
jgi:hypothetical protein